MPALPIAAVATSLPRRCGIATFSADVAAAMKAADPAVGVFKAAIDEPGVARLYPRDVLWRIEQGQARSYRAAADAINSSPVRIVNVQHEFGLYGVWRDGVYEDHLGPFLDALRKPVVTTLHTVPPEPSASMAAAVREIAALSDEVVVMSTTALGLLAKVYGVHHDVTVIPHGMPAIEPGGRGEAKRKLGLRGRMVISTFGLVDPRKGLEYMIEAMPAVVARHPNAVYVIAGQTHPELVRREGEQYREDLADRVSRLGLSDQVQFIDEFMELEHIIDLLRATDVYVTPYLDRQQVTSGTLVYAMGAGRAVVSTPYLHAVEALGDDRGILIASRDSKQLASAVSSILGARGLQRRLERRAYGYAKDMSWPAAGKRWVALMQRVISRSTAIRDAAEGGSRSSS